MANEVDNVLTQAIGALSEQLKCVKTTDTNEIAQTRAMMIRELTGTVCGLADAKKSLGT